MTSFGINFIVNCVNRVNVKAAQTHKQLKLEVESRWNVMAHGDAREGKWRGNWRMEWEASTLHTTTEHGVSSIITADAHTSAASSRLNWCPRRFKCTRPFRRKTKSGFCACAITFQTQSNSSMAATKYCDRTKWKEKTLSFTWTKEHVKDQARRVWFLSRDSNEILQQS